MRLLRLGRRLLVHQLKSLSMIFTYVAPRPCSMICDGWLPSACLPRGGWLIERQCMPRACGGKTAFVLAGGGSLGAVQVGMLKALTRAGIVPDLVVGASVGAINGAYFATAPSAEG